MASNSVVGTWALEVYELRPVSEGESAYPLGADARGRIAYTEEGYMSVFLMAADRPQVRGRSADVELKAAAYDTFIAYGGTYELRGDTVVHHVEFSSVPVWTGGDQERHVAFEDGKLVLTLPVTVAGAQREYRLVWHRETPAEAARNA